MTNERVSLKLVKILITQINGKRVCVWNPMKCQGQLQQMCVFRREIFNLQMSDELLTNEPANQLTYHNVLSSECCRQLITFGHK